MTNILPGIHRLAFSLAVETAQARLPERLVDHEQPDRADGFGFLAGGADLLDGVLQRGGVTLVVPFADDGQMLAQTFDRIAQRPFLMLVAGAIAAGVVGGRVRGAAIGEELDHRRTLVRPRPFLGPLGRRPDRQEVVAVHPQGRQTLADSLGGEGGLKPAGDALEGADGPLVVDDVQNDRSAIDRGEGQGVVEVALGRGAVADPADGDLVVALVGAGHGPSDGLRHLRAQIAADGEETVLLRRVHDRQLPALQRVGGVRRLFEHRALGVATQRRAGAQQALQAAGMTFNDMSRLIAGAGLAGVNMPQYFQLFSEWQHPFAEFHLTSDLHTACIGAHKGEDGAVIIIGTGSCGLADVKGQCLDIGGHGFPYGDNGSGAWFGMQLLHKVLLSLDQLAPQTKMTALLLQELAVTDSIGLVSHFMHATPTTYAKYAPLVFIAAEAGDAVALQLVEQGAAFIAAIAQRLLSVKPPRLAFIGGLAPKLLPYLPAAVQQQVTPALHTPELGAVWFAQQRSQAQSIAISL